MNINTKVIIMIVLLNAFCAMLLFAEKKDTNLSDAEIIKLQKQELYRITDIQAEELSAIKQVLLARQKALQDKNAQLEAELKLRSSNVGASSEEYLKQIRLMQRQLDSTKTALLNAKSRIDEYQKLLNNRSIGTENPEDQDHFSQLIQGANIEKFENSVMFAPGSTTLDLKSRKALREFAQQIASMGDAYVIQVIGNTDNVPITGELKKKYPSNWELSVARSVAVVKYLVETLKLNPKNIIVGGKSEYNPVVPNSTSKNRSENRRVDLLLSH
ncbi:MAG TPA: OmpA family protein [Candidatus Cloacimonadota bacterium]|nr:OmpA family protein [Candidatus Cloacimonadota bacterium]HPT71196.1 OmpA family protein [Candidatus Cloacimonadota bacterium]